MLVACLCLPSQSLPFLSSSSTQQGKVVRDGPILRHRHKHQGLDHHCCSWPSIPRGGESTTIVAPPGISPLVVSSPIVAAAVCQDGIVLLTLHNNVQMEQRQSDDESLSQSSPLADLPVDFAGPFRIQSLDLEGTTLLTAGWRADAMFLTSKAQEIVKQERQMVGSCPSSRLLATQLSLVLATSALGGDVSRKNRRRSFDQLRYHACLVYSFGGASQPSSLLQTRELHCVALLASISEGGSLWLVDQTGAYAVRALALGGGSIEVNALLNDKLRQVDWSDLTAKEGLLQILNFVSEQAKDSSQQQHCAEIAIVDFQGRRLVRKFLNERYQI